MDKLPKLKTEDLRLKDLMFTYENSHGEIVALTNRQRAEIIRRAEAYEGLIEALDKIAIGEKKCKRDDGTVMQYSHAGVKELRDIAKQAIGESDKENQDGNEES